MNRLTNRLRRAAERLDWADLILIGGCLIAAAANVNAGAWVVVPVVALVTVIVVRSAWWRTEFQAECESHDHTMHQLDEARAEVRRLTDGVVRWGDFEDRSGGRAGSRVKAVVDRQIAEAIRREQGGKR